MTTDFRDIQPTDMGWTTEGHARIVWSDGHASVFSPARLREICPCAECRGTHGTKPKAFVILTPQQVRGAPRQIVVERVERVGNYAVAFTWGDGHKDGIYSWPFLREQCPCDVCVTRRSIEVEDHA